MPSPKEIVQFFEESWYKKSGLVTVELIALVTLATLLVQANAHILVWALLTPSVLLCIYLFWGYTTRPPIVPKDKVGFLVCITCTDEAELRKIEEDFIDPLRKLVKSGVAGNTFYFLQMPQHFAMQVVDADSASEMRMRCRAHFMIYGRVKKRIINGKETHIVELEGAVAHQPISKKVQDSLVSEFTELLPRNVHISTENDLFSFQFTSEWAEVVARYIIGIAAACSGDLKYAESLYRDVLLRLNNKEHSFPVYRKLKERVPNRLAEIYEARATDCHNKWSETHNPAYLLEVDNWLNKIEPQCQDRGVAITLCAITKFLIARSPDESIKLLKKLKHEDGRIWQCNMAFLYAYKGNLKQAARHYRRASICNFELDNLYQIEEFICWMLEQEPSKYELYFCLGFVNWLIKEDMVLALEYFTKFIELCESQHYVQEQKLIGEWMNEILNKKQPGELMGSASQ
ncbi:MAG: hypothetical protein PHP70_01180 [Gallionella sp.]|nr:hypothetical protein [Gallionella sp.]